MNLMYSQNGYLVVDGLFTEQEISEIEEALLTMVGVGARTLLEVDWCASIAKLIQDRVRSDCVDVKHKEPVQCTYFQKNNEKNWLVSWHQDRSLPARSAHNINADVRVKEGQAFYQPSDAVLEQVVAVRLSIDDSHARNGGLKVIPKSHKHGILSESEIERIKSAGPVQIPTVPRGSVLIMSPLILHASSKASLPQSRRILHFTFA